MTDNPHRSKYPSEQDEDVARAKLWGLLTQGQCADLLAHHVQRAQDFFAEREQYIANLERENRKLSDKLNRFRNLTPGRKRLYALGRIAAALEYEADEMLKTSPGDGSGYQPSHTDYQALVEDALYLHRLQWDFEQLREVVYPSKQPAHEWKRP